MVVVGSVPFQRPDADSIIALANRVAALAREGADSNWRVLNVLHRVRSSSACVVMASGTPFHIWSAMVVIVCFRDYQSCRMVIPFLELGKKQLNCVTCELCDICCSLKYAEA